MKLSTTQRFIDSMWFDSIIPALIEYIKIPNKSPHFDPDWANHGYMEDAVRLIADWCRRQAPTGMSLEVIRLPGRTPLIFMDIPGQTEDCILLYGHLDKQPEMTGWAEGLGPWTPVLKDDKLYGRGGADDGYAAFASLAAIQAVRDQRLPHARCVVLIEACEESGSFDLPFYIDALKARIGAPSLVICLDSGAGNYEQMWITTSLRGLAGGVLRVEILKEGVHSGYASGVVPSSFRIVREFLERLEDAATGRIKPPALHVEIPSQRLEQTRRVAELLSTEIVRGYPFLEGALPMGANPLENLLNRNWRPALSVTGAEGLPALAQAGNVLRPQTTVKLSLRLPPTVDGRQALALLKNLFESDPPYGARVTFTGGEGASGWNAPEVAPWLERALEAASQQSFGASAMYTGEGGTIPFMAMLGERFPDAQFVITGVLGPRSNAHGPNEFLHIPYARKLTACIARVIADHGRRGDG
ncbi:MAG: M20 family metallopeptidase [Gammaproteobacteria bacterium]